MENNLTSLPDPNTVVSKPLAPNNTAPLNVVETPGVPPVPPKTGFKINWKFLGVFVGTVLVLLTGLSGVAVAVAYEKIDIKNPDLEKKISYTVQSIPFMPKTPRFLLEAAALSHAKVSKHNFDISVAAKSDDFTSSLGVNQVDVEAKGSVDYSDPKNIKIDMNASVTKDFNLDLRKNDSFVFIKINKVPDLLYSFLRMEKEKVAPVFENWIGIDTKPLDTEARRNLDEKTEDEKSVTAQYVTNMVDDLLDEKLLPKLQTSKEKLDNHSSVKIHLEADDKTVDDLINKIQNRLRGSDTKDRSVELRTTKPSDYIKDLNLDLWVDENSYYVRKIITSFKYNPNIDPVSGGIQPTSVLGIESGLYSLGSSQTSVVTAFKFDNFGEEFSVAKPDKYLTLNEFYAKLAEASGLYDNYQSSSGGTVELAARSRDAVRLSDAANLQQAIIVAVQESNQVLCSITKKYPCFGSSLTGSSVVDGSGWVKVNLSDQKSVTIPTLPKDPVNDTIYHYVYCANKDSFEINLVLESNQQKSKMVNDGGDDPNKFEIGSNLTLIGNVSGCKY